MPVNHTAACGCDPPFIHCFHTDALALVCNVVRRRFELDRGVLDAEPYLEHRRRSVQKINFRASFRPNQVRVEATSVVLIGNT